MGKGKVVFVGREMKGRMTYCREAKHLIFYR